MRSIHFIWDASCVHISNKKLQSAFTQSKYLILNIKNKIYFLLFIFAIFRLMAFCCTLEIKFHLNCQN